MDGKIFWDKETGAVYWMEGKELMQAPMNDDDTCNLSSAGSVDFSESAGDEARILAKLA
jgi:hypothetical protein